eukprot:1127321-Amphidinium_carterae.2
MAFEWLCSRAGKKASCELPHGGFVHNKRNLSFEQAQGCPRSSQEMMYEFFWNNRSFVLFCFHRRAKRAQGC